jgi:DNA-binding cell septation regulator SpoVG
MKGKKGDWIAWPASKKFDNKYHQDVYLLNAPLKEKIETAIFKTYLSKVKDKK